MCHKSRRLSCRSYLGYGECRCNHYNLSNDTCWYLTGDGCPKQSSQAGALAISRPIGQVMEIASISGNTVTFTTPFHMTYRLSHTARLARHGFFNQGQNSGTASGVPVSHAGVEQKQSWPGLGGIGTPDSPPNPLPVLPSSLYIHQAPGFMGTNPWPWVDPSTGATYVLPARARFDSGTPNTL